MNDFIITASNARATTTDVTDGVDVDIVFSVDGGAHHTGTVTLAPSGSGLAASWARGPDEWVSRDLLRALSGLDDSSLRGALDAIEAEAADVAAR